MKPGFSAMILNTPFLNLTALKPAKSAKHPKMNVLQGNYIKIRFAGHLGGVPREVLSLPFICFREWQAPLLNETGSF